MSPDMLTDPNKTRFYLQEYCYVFKCFFVTKRTSRAPSGKSQRTLAKSQISHTQKKIQRRQCQLLFLVMAAIHNYSDFSQCQYLKKSAKSPMSVLFKLTDDFIDCHRYMFRCQFVNLDVNLSFVIDLI